MSSTRSPRVTTYHALLLYIHIYSYCTFCLVSFKFNTHMMWRTKHISSILLLIGLFHLFENQPWKGLGLEIIFKFFDKNGSKWVLIRASFWALHMSLWWIVIFATFQWLSWKHMGEIIFTWRTFSNASFIKMYVFNVMFERCFSTNKIISFPFVKRGQQKGWKNKYFMLKTKELQ